LCLPLGVMASIVAVYAIFMDSPYAGDGVYLSSIIGILALVGGITLGDRFDIVGGLLYGRNRHNRPPRKR
jgi:hypothetical protein